MILETSEKQTAVSGVKKRLKGVFLHIVRHIRFLKQLSIK